MRVIATTWSFSNMDPLCCYGYLKIVEKHASGLLPEMRKDGKTKNIHFA